MKKTAIVLFNLGGPNDLKSVKAFLFSLFNDKAIISLPQPFRFLLAQFIAFKRNKIAQEIYKNIGGKSPILEITNAQAENLEKELSYYGDFKVFVCMRHSCPKAKEVVRQIKEYSPEEIVTLPLYPQFSTTTSGSAMKDFDDQVKKQKLNIPIKYTCCYPDNELFVFSHVRLIKNAINKAKADGFDQFRLLFSAHGLPQKIVEKGDPYVFQIELSVKEIVKKINKDLKKRVDYKICYQSKVGPLKWTSPSLETEIKRAAIDKKAVIIIPIAFVSDHSETLVELDIEYKELAEKKKIPYYLRVPALNSDGYFIKALANIALRTADGNVISNENDLQSCDSDKGQEVKGNRICPKKYKQCLNVDKCGYKY